MSTTTIYSPLGVRHVDEGGLQTATPISALSVIGIVDNTKPNAVDLMRSSVERLTDVIGDVSVRVERKTSASEGVSETAFGKLEQEASVVLVGSGD